ncbi:MAG: peptidylprolyl isomerase [Polyangiales bacterium]
MRARHGIALCLLLACGKREPAPAAEQVDPKRHGLTKQQAEEALVVLGDKTITVGEFAEQLADKSPYLRARYQSPERRRELLEELVKFELLAAEAKKRGLEQSEDVQRTKRQLMVQQMMKAEFEDKVKLTDISDAEIKAYYDAHPEEFNKPSQVRASAIVSKDEGKAKKLLKQLKDKPGDDALFRELASSSSNEDASLKERAGDLQFFSKPSERAVDDPPLDPALAEAAFKLENIGDLAPEPVKLADGWAIVRLTGKRKELARTLDQTRRTIQHKLWRERRESAVEQFVKSLRGQADVHENWDLLAQVKIEPAVLSAPDAGAHQPAPAPRSSEGRR